MMSPPGYGILKRIEGLGRWLRFCVSLLGATARLLTGRYGLGALSEFRRVLSLQVYYAGVQAAILAAGAGAVLGGVVLGIGWPTLADFGSQEYFGELLRLALLEELGPLITALFMIARSGTAITTELARMRLHHETEAMRVHGVDPLAYLAAPRLLGVAISNMALTVIVCGAGYLAAIGLYDHVETFSRAVFAQHLLRAILPGDVLLCLLKGLLFGLVIPPIAIYHGLTMPRDPNEIPRAGIRSVVSSLVLVFALDGLLAFA